MRFHWSTKWSLVVSCFCGVLAYCCGKSVGDVLVAESWLHSGCLTAVAFGRSVYRSWMDGLDRAY